VAEQLAKTLNIPLPVVVRNAVDIRELTPAVPIARNANEKIIAHTGVLLDGRHLPELVESLTHLPTDIALALIGDGKLRKQLINDAQRWGVTDRVKMIFPVTPQNMPTTLAQADASIMLITSKRLSYHLSLPNKFFEAVAAGVPIVSSPIPEVMSFIDQYDIGLICDPDDMNSVVEKIMAVLQPENNARFRANVLRMRDTLTWENEERKLVALYKRLLD
jgi:glycosyltransferase involved in cell wall biosynthesis